MQTNLFSYNKAKVIQALRYHFISRPEIKFMIIVINIFSIGTAVLYALKIITAAPFLVSTLLWFFLMVIFWYALPVTIYSREKTFKDNFVAYFTSSEFAIENNTGSRSWPWSSFSSWMETPFFFHLYFNARSFFIIPKDAFNDDDVHETRVLLNEKIQK